MRQLTNQALFIFFLALFILLVHLLASILTPFLLGALLAYLADPLVKRLDRWGVPHTGSVISIFVALFMLFLLLIFLLFPLIQQQINTLIDVIPQAVTWLQETALPWIKEYVNVETLKATLSASISKTGLIYHAVITSGYTMVEWLVNLVLTPVVMFYLLRDWDQVLQGINSLLPRSIEPTVVKLAKECDAVLGEFFRGQLLVMLAMCVIYSLGLTMVGLQIGVVLGVIGGLLSIVPYLGSIFIVVSASITALVQYGTWQSLLWVWGVYLIGQGIEGYVLTPYLVGERIGLHPVAVIFAIMAGGALFGFFGVLIALPTAAVIMVLVRFANQRYQLSRFYKG
ncbi:MAG: AI-2E family transporter [Gammaproteobacteria bacterium]|nr:MAG: AI-2E family transporter [Gammaproteobacteria bacterium]